MALELLWGSLFWPMRRRWDLEDEEWAVVEPVLRPARREDNRGQPRHETRAVVNGVFWVLSSGGHWHELPERYPPATGASSSGFARASWLKR